MLNFLPYWRLCHGLKYEILRAAQHDPGEIAPIAIQAFCGEREGNGGDHYATEEAICCWRRA
jgi:hypothetical protein